ncbi:hypothetical protein BGS_0691 [Beggiatoa sp. SS]|nr:hypothetical protein BGS_0691 [Beggiatoa sp. SS]
MIFLYFIFPQGFYISNDTGTLEIISGQSLVVALLKIKNMPLIFANQHD